MCLNILIIEVELFFTPHEISTIQLINESFSLIEISIRCTLKFKMM